jgi:hypothetical protein
MSFRTLDTDEMDAVNAPRAIARGADGSTTEALPPDVRP